MGQELTVEVPGSAAVDALLLRPDGAVCLLVLAHGAGAGMRHPFMEHLARELAARHVATLRYNFPYVQKGSSRPDPPAVLQATVRAAVATASEAVPELPLLAGGKSMGGRMTSLTFSEGSSGQAAVNTRARGLVFFGFPLHQAGRPATARADHLTHVRLPMLFLQGTRDSLADLALLRPVCHKLGARATLHVVETADHSFHVLKRSGRTDAEVLREIAGTVASWAATLL
jgi:predicted alpha/beta-hydrolase family hydrolase